jgi:hypothetical protein
MTGSTPTSPAPIQRLRRIGGVLGAITGVVVIVLLGLMAWWDGDPEPLDPVAAASARAAESGKQAVVGYVTADTVVRLIDGLLDKPGGYLSNDIAPPGLWMDNVPNHEFGQLQQLRDFTLALRNDFSRSGTQSADDVDLREAQPLLASPNDRWLLPSTEDQYRKAAQHIAAYRDRLADPARQDTQFYARADNLADWLGLVDKQLGSLSQRLTAAVASERVDTDLGNDPSATQSTPRPAVLPVRTPWTRIDDNFYEARGQAYALLHLLKAIEHDFAQVLKDKNATPVLEQIIRELEATQQPVWSPVILNGSGFGLTANHSLAMSSYITRANAAIAELRRQLTRG